MAYTTVANCAIPALFRYGDTLEKIGIRNMLKNVSKNYLLADAVNVSKPELKSDSNIIDLLLDTPVLSTETKISMIINALSQPKLSKKDRLWCADRLLKFLKESKA